LVPDIISETAESLKAKTRTFPYCRISRKNKNKTVNEDSEAEKKKKKKKKIDEDTEMEDLQGRYWE
jgi:hypothetical protein